MQQLLARNSRRFGSPDVCRALSLWSYTCRHQDPRRMLELAEVAVRVAQAIPDGEMCALLLADTRAEAHLHLAHAQRVNNRLRRADAAFRKARRWLEAGSGDPLLAAKFAYFRGTLRAAQRRWPEAVQLLEEARAVYEGIGESHRAAEALVSLGRAQYQLGNFDGALRSLFVALDGLERGRDRHVALVTVQLIVLSLADAGFPQQATLLLQEVWPLFDLRSTDVLLLRFRWLEGRLLAQQGQHLEALSALDRVRRAFADLELPYDSALAALDLAALYAQRGRLQRVAELALEVYPTFKAEGIEPEAQRALVLFVEAAEHRTVTAAQIARLRQRLERHRDRRR